MNIYMNWISFLFFVERKLRTEPVGSAKLSNRIDIGWWVVGSVGKNKFYGKVNKHDGSGRTFITNVHNGRHELAYDGWLWLTKTSKAMPFFFKGMARFMCEYHK